MGVMRPILWTGNDFTDLSFSPTFVGRDGMLVKLSLDSSNMDSHQRQHCVWPKPTGTVAALYEFAIDGIKATIRVGSERMARVGRKIDSIPPIAKQLFRPPRRCVPAWFLIIYNRQLHTLPEALLGNSCVPFECPPMPPRREREVFHPSLDDRACQSDNRLR